MKKIALIIIIITLNIDFYCQEEVIFTDSVQTIRLPEYYDGMGAIFPASAKIWPRLSKVKERFTPTIEEVSLAEKLIYNEVNNYYRNDTTVINAFLFKLRYYYYRQYFGYIEYDGSKIIVVHYMNYIKAPCLYTEWNKVFKLEISEIISDNTHGYYSRIYGINITKGFRIQSELKLDWN
jgi:hypothetical protein